MKKSNQVEKTAADLAVRLFHHSRRKQKLFADALIEMYNAARDKDILIIHSPGGWGNMPWKDIQGWEQSIVTGVTSTLEELGYSTVMRQYLRSGDALWGGKSIYKEAQVFLFGKSYRAEVFAEQLKFITGNLPELKIVLVAASQGASFNNTAMMKLDNNERIYSIELGTFFPHMKRRRLTEKNLAIDSNGFMEDPMCHRNLWAGTKAYIKAFYRWFKHKVQGNDVKFTHCINTPGHEYKWEYPEVHENIIGFLTANFSEKH